MLNWTWYAVQANRFLTYPLNQYLKHSSGLVLFLNRVPIPLFFSGSPSRLTIILQTFYSVFVLHAWNFLHDGPLNRCACLTINIFILWTKDNEIMHNLHCVGNKSEILQLKKNSIEMFSAYTQEVNLKKCIIFNLFYLRFCFWPQVCIGNTSFRICGFVPWRGGVRNIILLHTRISYFLNTSLTTFLFTPLAIHTRHCHEPRKTYVYWVLFQYANMRYRFQYVFHDGESRISTWYVLTLSRKE